MSQITEAASILLARAPGSEEVYLVARSLQLRFMGGMVAFPGGKVHSSDHTLASPEQGLTARHVAAVRETFEETGVLLARDDYGRPPPASPDLVEFRRRLLADQVTFADLLGRAGLRIDPADLTPAGQLVTPPFSPLRFDTTFFVAHLPPGQHAEIWPGELSTGFWHSAAAALDLWQRGELMLSPPTVSLLDAIRGQPVSDLSIRVAPLMDQLGRGHVPPIWFAPGVLMIPLDCQGLAPTTHTNAFLVGSGPAYLIDPGPADPVEQEKLFAALAGRRIDAIVLTHHHPDHVGAASVCARRYRVPVLAHRLTAERLAGTVAVDRFLDEGDVLDLGLAPHGRGPWHLRALFTPGHAPGHLAFYEPEYQLLFAGDVVSPLSSMIISPEDGDLTLYLDSLRRLRDLPMRLLLPSHGGGTARGLALLDESLAHREQREKQLLGALADRPRCIEDLARELYRGFPEGVLRLARLQIHTGLLKLQREGRVKLVGGRWEPS